MDTYKYVASKVSIQDFSVEAYDKISSFVIKSTIEDAIINYLKPQNGLNQTK